MRNYFKKFSIMFMMVVMFIAVGMIQSGNTVNAATVGQKLTSPESGWQRFDDTNSNIVKKGKWSSVTGSIFSGGSIAYSDTSGATIKFIFYGTSFRIIDEENTNRSNPISISIDGNSDTYNPNGFVQQNTVVYQKLNLQLGIHSVVITNGNSRIGLDAIDSDGYLLSASILLDKSTMNLNVGDLQQLTATTTPAGAQVTWKSSDPTIASVDSTGKVTGVKEGTCTITATTADGLAATCVVTVTPKGIEPNPNPTPDPTDTEYITNVAHAKGTNTNNPGGEVTIIFHGTADTTLSVVKTADVKDVWIGDNFTYTLVITNTGTKTAKAVVVNDPAPNHIDFNVSGVTTTQGSIDSSSTSKNITVNVGDILPGGTVTIKVPATVIE
jgi:uncharacterized repeat protein (TIGR01451 family)